MSSVARDAVITFPMLGDFEITLKNYIAIGNFKIYWYGVIIAIGFALAVVYCMRRAKDFGLTQDHIYDIILIGVPAAIVGCRLYYVAFRWELYRGDLLSIFNIRDGGMGMYGGIILAVLCVWIYARKKKIPLGAILDMGAFGFIIGQIVGRWGNFINREAFGGVTDLPWKMGLTANGVTTYVHPTFLYESLWNLIGFFILRYVSKKHRTRDGQIFALYAAWYGVARMFLEVLRTDSLYLFGTNIPISMIVGFLSVVGCFVFMGLTVNKKPEDMYVNRVALAAAEAEAGEEETEETAAEEADAADEEAAEDAPQEENNEKE